MNLKLLITVILSFSCLTACSPFKASPAPDSGFLKGTDRLKHKDYLPFHAAWRRSSIDDSKYDSFYIAPVNLEYLFRTSDWSKINIHSKEEIASEARNLAEYFRAGLSRELSGSKVNLVDRPGERTVTLEVAIVELVPTDVVRNATGSVVGFFIPGGGLVSAGAAGSIAIEARYVEANTSELAIFKDREQAKIAPIDLAGLTPFQHAKNSIDDWVVQISEIMTTPHGTPVSDSAPFRLSPW